jgi:hypothetical protein
MKNVCLIAVTATIFVMMTGAVSLAGKESKSMDVLQGEKIGEYNYNYTYKGTKVTHLIEEFENAETGITVVATHKETRKGENFVRLPNSIWVTKDGYPPLGTDGAILSLNGKYVTLYTASMPTVQSPEHIKIFDDSLRADLKELGLDYDQLAKGTKNGEGAREMTTTGFFYLKKGANDPEILKVLQEKAVKAYAKVLAAKPQPCPVDFWREKITGPQGDFEFHMFKKWGFDVPLMAQKAFFMITHGARECYMKSNEDMKKLEALTNTLWGD